MNKRLFSRLALTLPAYTAMPARANLYRTRSVSQEADESEFGAEVQAVAIFSVVSGGLMYEAGVAGPKFKFKRS